MNGSVIIFTNVCDRVNKPIKIEDIYVPPESPPAPPSLYPHIPPRNPCSEFCQHQLVVPVLDLVITGVGQRVLSCVWLLLLRLSGRFLFVVICRRACQPSVAVSIAWREEATVAHCPADGHLGGFPLLTITNKAALNILILHRVL